MKVCVVIPTYNEKDSIRRTLERVLANGPDYHVLVVDDNSPDDTAAVVAAFAREQPRVHLLVRLDDRGFGTAVRDGFRRGADVWRRVRRRDGRRRLARSG